MNDLLVGRQQRVRTNSKLSGCETVFREMPKDTVVGPVLFLLCANDPLSLLSPSILLYAEDVNIWKAVKNEGVINGFKMTWRSYLNRLEFDSYR